MQPSRRRIALLVHGGAGNTKDNEDGCIAAARTGFDRLRAGDSALDAAVAAVVVLEDDERFNAGTGSVVRTDGVTVETDASVMDSLGALGAVACLQRVKNPVLVAHAVVGTRHWLLAGAGAQTFARASGFADHALKGRHPADGHASAMHVRGAAGCDTVGAVALDLQGRFAVASSTGGSAPALVGRVGDTPIPGCGYWAGPAGAIAATGIGEHIVQRLLARTVYEWIERGMPLRQAIERGVALFPDHIDVGLIAVTTHEAASASNRSMPVHLIEQDKSD